MKKLILLGFMSLALAGCQTVEEARAQRNAVDDADCRSYGAKPGSDSYVRCRTDLARNRSIENEARRPVIVSGVYGDPFFAPRPFCRPTPFGLRCY